VIRKINLIANLDWLTILVYLSLVFIGWINIYASAYTEAHPDIFDMSQKYGKQFVWIAASMFLAFIVLLIDSRFYSFFAYVFYGIIILLLVLVLFFGQEIHGSKAWFQLGNFSFQPSEFAKFLTGLALARYVSSYNLSLKNLKAFGIALLIILLPMILIVLEHDMGSSLVYIALLLPLFREGLSAVVLLIAMILAALFLASLMLNKLHIILVLAALGIIIYTILGRSLKQSIAGAFIISAIAGAAWIINSHFDLNISSYFIIIGALLLASAYFLVYGYFHKLKLIPVILLFLMGSIAFTYSVNYVFNNILQEHQQRRISIVLGIESDPLGVGYNVNQSKIAIGSGGYFGKGFLNGTQTKFDFVPEQSTDFIFCTVGEEWGFIGSFVLLSLFILLLLRLIHLAERQRSQFSRIFGYVVVSILFFHIAINIGMTIGLMPVIGIPLPFISYGGSSLWSFTLMLFIFLRLDASRMEILR